MQQQKQQEEQRQATPSAGAEASAVGSSSGSTRVQWAASASSVWGASAPGFDILEPVVETYHNFCTFKSFVYRYQEVNPGSDVGNTFDFLKLVWPDALTSEIHVIETALQLAVEGQCVRVPWVAILDNDDPEDPPRHTRQVPPSYGVADSLNYYHGSPVYNLPGVRKNKLKPSDHGAGSKTPMLYTCKKTYRAFAYLQQASGVAYLPDGPDDGLVEVFPLRAGYRQLVTLALSCQEGTT